MRSANDLRLEVDKLNEAVSDLTNLIAALQVVCGQLIEVRLEKGSEIAQLRKAVVAIGCAMEDRAQRAWML